MSALSNLTYEVRKLVALETYRSKRYGISDLLIQDMFVADGVIKNKDESFSISYRYYGKSLDSLTDDDLNYLSDKTLTNAFERFGDGWSMHLVCDRSESVGYISGDKCHFTNPSAEIMDIERRMNYESEGVNYENEFTITLTYCPTGMENSKTGNAIQKFYANKDSDGPKTNWRKYLAYFIEQIAEFYEMIRSEIKLTKISNEEIMECYHYYINGYRLKYRKPKLGWLWLSNMLAHNTKAGFQPKVGDKYIGVVSVGAGLPPDSWPAYLNALSTLDFEYLWTTRFIFLDKDTAKQMADETTNFHQSQRKPASQKLSPVSGGIERINRSADIFADQSEYVIEQIDTTNINYGKYTCTIVIFDEDRHALKDKIKKVKAVLNRAGFKAEHETWNVFEAYLGSIPGMVRPNVRKWNISTPNLADIMPTTSVWPGYKSNPCRYYKEAGNDPVLFYANTIGNTPFRGCLHSGDIGHTLIGGPLNTGKSVLASFISAQENRYKGFANFIFDHGWKSMPLCYAVNGVHFDIGSDPKIGFKPLEYLDTQEDLAFVEQWLIEIAMLNGYQVNSNHRLIINSVLHIIKAQALPEQRTMSYFHLQLKSKDEGFAEVFKPYTKENKGSGLQSTLFDAKVDIFKFSNYNVFEMSILAKQGDAIYIPAIRLILQLINRKLQGNPASVKFEEVSMLVKNPVFCSFFSEIANSFASKNCYFVICTSSLSDVFKSDLKDILLDSCPTKILLPNKSADTNEYTRSVYYLMGLNDKQISLISEAIPQYHYYFTNPDGNRLISLGLGSVALAFLAHTSIEDLKKAKIFKHKFKDRFGYHWLIEYGQSEAAEYWDVLYKKYNDKPDGNKLANVRKV